MNLDLKEKIKYIYDKLSKEYPQAKCQLNYSTPLELLISTILSAQCTDERVNIVTKKLFEKFRSLNDYANADKNELIGYIKSTGFFNNKAKNIIELSKVLIEKYNSNIPDNIDELTTLPGIGRKTANVIVGNCFNKPAIIVDTHFKRLINRIGLIQSKNPDKIEFEIKKIISEDKQTFFSHLITTHGRKVCNAKKPLCERCVISNVCDFYINKKSKV